MRRARVRIKLRDHEVVSIADSSRGAARFFRHHVAHGVETAGVARHRERLAAIDEDAPHLLVRGWIALDVAARGWGGVARTENTGTRS
jgi:hypothetical protein